MPTILITNDDGVHDPGLFALKQRLESIADVIVLAPERNRSAASHARTMHKPLRLRRAELPDGSTGHYCSGTPADCVAMVACGALDVQPDLVVSGINAGFNMSLDVYYSGTVACAREALFNGWPSIAISTAFPHIMKDKIHEVRQLAAELTRDLAVQILRDGLPPQTMLNVNVPGVTRAEMKGIHVTRLGKRSYPQILDERKDPFGRSYYWPIAPGPQDMLEDGTDVGAVANGYTSVTPVMLDVTNYKAMSELETWIK